MYKHDASVLAGLLLAVVCTHVAAVGTELNCMVFTYSSYDYEFNGGTSPCIKEVEMAKQRCGGTRLNFVPTHFWVDADKDGTVDYYCYRLEGGKCIKVTQAMVDAFTAGMQKCMAKAVALGYSIEITPHIDDGLGQGGWRNALVFDPSVPYGGMSYVDMMVKPLAQALSAVMNPDTRVWFATQGEMSATVIRYPKSWAALIPKVKAWVGGSSPEAQARVEVGVSTNFNKLCACVLMDLVDPEEYLQKLPAALKPIMHEFDIPEITKLYDQVDFIGMSNYASMPENFTDEDLENAARQFATEAKNFGIDLETLLTKKGKKLHFSEYGVGGGTCNTGDCPAKTPAEAAATPFFGIFGEYSKATDPWTTPAVKAWVRKFYKSTAAWLKKGGGPTYKVDGLYMWNLASWDVVGIHSSSTSADGSYFDGEISDTILQHNAAIAAANPETNQTTVTPKLPDEIPTGGMPLAEDNKTKADGTAEPLGGTSDSATSLLDQLFRIPTDEEPKGDPDAAVKPDTAATPAANTTNNNPPRDKGEGSAVTPAGKAHLQKKIEDARKALREASQKVNDAVQTGRKRLF